MDVLTAILACSLYADEKLVRAVVESSSQNNPYAVVDPAADYDPETQTPPRTLEAALGRAEQIRQAGGIPLFGLMQIPTRWAEAFGRQERELFDPCVNISIGTAMLSVFEHECRPKAERARGTSPARVVQAATYRSCTIRRYGEAIGAPDLAMVTELELRAARGHAPVDGVCKAPILYVGEDRSWGADRVLFDITRDLKR